MTQEYILVCVAWPYGNAEIHQGNMTGAYLPADIYARYHRLIGNHVLMVSGTDSHGTPVTLAAEAQDTTPKAVFESFHAGFLETFLKLGLTYDLFTHTDTENHHRVSQGVFENLRQNEYLYRKTSEQLYSAEANKFLPDRYVEGTCPKCGYSGARGDQCDNCNTLFESAAELIEPRSKHDASSLEMRETEHFFLDLPALATDGLSEWMETGKEHWRPQVINFAGNFVREGLIGRAVTRDMNWGIPIPGNVEGFENKVMYVWFEAVIGYLSAPIEWSKNNNQPDAWQNWWYGDNSRTVYFVGKDNIPFHAVFWPAELMGVSGLFHKDPQAKLNLPYDVPANEFMNMEGRKISGSRNWGVWILDALERHDPDPLRYYLTAAMPETRDSDWTWAAYVERNNKELVANWGNLANRVLKMIQRYFGGVVPEDVVLGEESKALLAAIDAGFETIGALYDACKFRAALQGTMALSTQVNQYLERTSPWKTAKTDMTATKESLFTALQAINGLKMLFSPVLPFSSQALHEMMGEASQLFGEQKVVHYHESEREHDALTYDGSQAVGRWLRELVPAGRKLPKPGPLFKRLPPEVLADEMSRLGIS